MEEFPIVYSAHHASDDFGYKDFSERCALTPEQRLRFSDYGTGLTVPRHGAAHPLLSRYSRGIVDLNNPDDWSKCFKTEDFGKSSDGMTSQPNKIWLPGKEPTDGEKAGIMAELYYPYYKALLGSLQELERQKCKRLLVVGWDNTADYNIGKNKAKEDVWMPTTIVSNGGVEEGTEVDPEKGKPTLCEPQFAQAYADYLQQALRRYRFPDDVHLNLVYKGGNIPETFTHRRNPDLEVDADVQSIQLEYNTKLTHDQKTLAPNHLAIQQLRVAAEEAMRDAWLEFQPQKTVVPQADIPAVPNKE